MSISERWDCEFLSNFFIGERLQDLCKAGVIEYNPLVGHLSDIGVSGSLVGLTMMATSRMGGLVRAISSLIPHALLTFHEFYPTISPTENVFDLKDILAYWITAGITYSIVESLSKLKNSKHKDKKPLNFIKSIFCQKIY